jgi:hypothetical protein
MSIHEITHVRQSLNAGGLNFNSDGKLTLSGTRAAVSAMEVEAYRMQYSYDRSFPCDFFGGGGLRGINIHSVGGIIHDNQLLYPVIFQLSSDRMRDTMRARQMFGLP